MARIRVSLHSKTAFDLLHAFILLKKRVVHFRYGHQLLRTHADCFLDVRAVITQWAVFALRNVLDDNAQNQAFVGELKLQALSESRLDTLRQFGVDAHMDGDKIVIKNVTSLSDRDVRTDDYT